MLYAWTPGPVFTGHYLIFNRTCPGKYPNKLPSAARLRTAAGGHSPRRSVVQGLQGPPPAPSLLPPFPSLPLTASIIPAFPLRLSPRCWPAVTPPAEPKSTKQDSAWWGGLALAPRTFFPARVPFSGQPASVGASHAFCRWVYLFIFIVFPGAVRLPGLRTPQLADGESLLWLTS